MKLQEKGVSEVSLFGVGSQMTSKQNEMEIVYGGGWAGEVEGKPQRNTIRGSRRSGERMVFLCLTRCRPLSPSHRLKWRHQARHRSPIPRQGVALKG